MKIRDKIIRLLSKSGDATVKQMVDAFDASKQAIHVAIQQLLEERKVIRFGRAPKTIYSLASASDNILNEPEVIYGISDEERDFLSSHFLIITEIGQMKEGAEGFSHWCNQRKLPFIKTVKEYIATQEKYAAYSNSTGVINGMEKLESTKELGNINLDEIYYLDFYAIERFGKTRLGTLLHYAKQGQNKFLMKKMVEEIKTKVYQLIKEHKYDAVCIVPPTIKREVQLMKYLEVHLGVNLPMVKIQKVTGLIPVPQKSLNKINERINNANATFSITETIKYKHVLLIDDAVGSGATMNQVAAKLKQKSIAKKVTGLAVVGSFKGFDVVTDV